MAADDTFQQTPGPRLASLPSSPMAEPAARVNDALLRLIEAQSELAATLEHQPQETRSLDEIEVLLSEAQATADQIVERAELEALTIRRLMRIEAERLIVNVERLKERAQRLESNIS
jgi:hypothetical protein